MPLPSPCVPPLIPSPLLSLLPLPSPSQADIRGFNRTYVGSQPGRIIQGLKQAKSCDPVLLLDEIDKISTQSANGNPAAAMLEVLDPAQNSTFVDHYIGCPFDLSKIVFIATANSLDTIPAPLLDRMEVIQLSGFVSRSPLTTLTDPHPLCGLTDLLPSASIPCNVSTKQPIRLLATRMPPPRHTLTRTHPTPHAPTRSYTMDEKVNIATKYIIPRQMQEHGIEKEELLIPENTLGAICDKYTREAGVRSLERHVAALCRSAVVKMVEKGVRAVQMPDRPAEEENAAEETTEQQATAADAAAPAQAADDDVPRAPRLPQIIIEEDALFDILGPPTYLRDEEPQRRLVAPGIAMGLAASQVGGSVLFVEATKMSGSGRLKLTGSLGDVIQESANLALTWIRSHSVGADPCACGIMGYLAAVDCITVTLAPCPVRVQSVWLRAMRWCGTAAAGRWANLVRTRHRQVSPGIVSRHASRVLCRHRPRLGW